MDAASSAGVTFLKWREISGILAAPLLSVALVLLVTREGGMRWEGVGRLRSGESRGTPERKFLFGSLGSGMLLLGSLETVVVSFSGVVSLVMLSFEMRFLGPLESAVLFFATSSLTGCLLDTLATCYLFVSLVNPRIPEKANTHI